VDGDDVAAGGPIGHEPVAQREIRKNRELAAIFRNDLKAAGVWRRLAAKAPVSGTVGVTLEMHRGIGDLELPVVQDAAQQRRDIDGGRELSDADDLGLSAPFRV